MTISRVILFEETFWILFGVDATRKETFRSLCFVFFAGRSVVFADFELEDIGVRGPIWKPFDAVCKS